MKTHLEGVTLISIKGSLSYAGVRETPSLLRIGMCRRDSTIATSNTGISEGANLVGKARAFSILRLENRFKRG